MNLRLKQELRNNRIEWVDYSDAELNGGICDSWPTLEEAKAAIEWPTGTLWRMPSMQTEVEKAVERLRKHNATYVHKTYQDSPYYNAFSVWTEQLYEDRTLIADAYLRLLPALATFLAVVEAVPADWPREEEVVLVRRYGRRHAFGRVTAGELRALRDAAKGKTL